MTDSIDPHPPKGPGHVVLYDYYKPTLYPGNYTIEAKQDISAPNEPNITIYNYNSQPPVPTDPSQPPPIEKHKFRVVASHFEIDPKLVNSVYPPDGGADEGRILPHIVFNDPHLPWEIPPFAPAAEPFFEKKVWPPWIALVVFDPTELKIDLPAHPALNIPEKTTHSPYSGAYKMSVSDYLTRIGARPDFEKGYDFDRAKLKNMGTSSNPVDVIFPSKDIINDILKNPAKFKYMCHVRQLDTHGLPETGAENKGLYSICVSHRSGPLMVMNPDNPPAPRPQVVHLISIECLVDKDGNLVPPKTANGSDRVGLVSLYNWTYLATPPSSNSVISRMKDLGASKQPLMPPKPILDTVTVSVSKGIENQQAAARKLHARLKQGYTIARWRTATGEESAVFNRGPLIPNVMSSTPSKDSNNWPDSSNTGKDYQILDKSTGLIDMTYSAAWQLGKMLAIGDTVFAQALLRFRSTVHNRASSSLRLLGSRLTQTPELLNRMTGALEDINDGDSLNRAPMRASLPLPKSAGLVHDTSSVALLQSTILQEVSLLAGIGAINLSGLSASPDFEAIKNWLDKKLLLFGIPFHYLITDPSHLSSAPDGKFLRGKIDLPPEALRFFYIDDNWLDCLVDGALSTANHQDLLDDSVRRAIKQIYNEYLKETKKPTTRYGFLLRSSIVRSIPDLRVTAKYRKSDGRGGWMEDSERNPVLRYARLDEYTVLNLLECFPEDLYSIVISQPAHQQRFVAPVPPVRGQPYSIKRLYTAGAPERSPSQRGPGAPQTPDADGMWQELPQANVSAWYSSRTRCVDVERMTADLGQLLPFSNPPAEFNAPIGSAVFALELNDKAYHLEIHPPEGSPLHTPVPQRQLWLRPSLITRPQSGSEPRRIASNLGEQSGASVLRDVIHPSVRRRPSTLHAEMRVLSLRAQDPASTPILSGPRIVITPVEQPVFQSDRYLLAVHPSSRPTPLLPFSSTNRKVYSSTDYVPTKSNRLTDLVFTLRRNLSGISSGILVSSITIIIPTTASDTPAEEPLITAPYRGPGASMLHNKRLTPIITAAPGQLQVKLVARNATANAELTLANAHTADASFILKGCDIAATQNMSTIEVMGEGMVPRGVAKLGVRRRGRRLGLNQPATVLDWEVHLVKKDVEI